MTLRSDIRHKGRKSFRGCKMKAYSDFRGFAATADNVVAGENRSAFTAEPQLKMHNPRGLVLAILLSAACWAGVGLAFLL